MSYIKDKINKLKNNKPLIVIVAFIFSVIVFVNIQNVLAVTTCPGGLCGTGGSVPCYDGEYQSCNDQANANCPCGWYANGEWGSCRRGCSGGSGYLPECGGLYCCTSVNGPSCTYNCNSCCTPNCSGKTCGDNGCGGSCGSCSGGYHCSNYQCVPDIAITDITCPTYSGNSIKVSNIANLRTWTNTAQSQSGRAQTTWTDATLTGKSMRTIYLQELCTAITSLKTSLGVTSSHTCSTSLSGLSVRAYHIQETCAILHDISVAY